MLHPDAATSLRPGARSVGQSSAQLRAPFDKGTRGRAFPWHGNARRPPAGPASPVAARENPAGLQMWPHRCTPPRGGRLGPSLAPDGAGSVIRVRNSASFPQRQVQQAMVTVTSQRLPQFLPHLCHHTCSLCCRMPSGVEGSRCLVPPCATS